MPAYEIEYSVLTPEHEYFIVNADSIDDAELKAEEKLAREFLDYSKVTIETIKEIKQ